MLWACRRDRRELLIALSMSNIVPVCAILPTQLARRGILETLDRILACEPAPAEVRVHVNGGGRRAVSEEEIAARFPGVIVSRGDDNLGPGGARNLLVEASGYEYVAGFDDDSYPIDRDYFGRVAALFDAYPEAAVLWAAIFHRGEQVRPDTHGACWVWKYVGCGCAYRRSRFLAAGGHVVRWVAYTVEEPDLSLRLLESGERMLHSPWLRVRHDTTLEHHAEPKINAGALANVALAGWVRYPASALWQVPFQIANRCIFCARSGRWAGLWSGLWEIPGLLWRYRHERRPVSSRTLRRYRRERALRPDAAWRVPKDVE